LISACNSSIAPWHGQALGEFVGRIGTLGGTVMQFPFPSLKYPIAHEIVLATDFGKHPPCPSVT